MNSKTTILKALRAPRAFLTGLVLFVAMAMGAQGVDLMPQFHGALRSRFEMDTRTGQERFQVRNARLNIAGRVAQPIDYYVQADFCDRGKMKILDAWGRIAVSQRLKVQAGQFRIPFGTDCFKGPANYVFANRAFLVKNMSNIRGVGAKLSYSYSWLTAEAGAFNPTSISDQERWVKSLAYAGKLRAHTGAWTFDLGAETVIPDSVRVKLLGGSATYSDSKLTVSGEYMYEHYTRSRHKDAHAWVVWGDYRIPAKVGVFNQASFQARWDGITAHSSGKHVDGELITDTPARQRATIGATLSYIKGPVHCDIRLDYEKYFYHNHYKPSNPDADDKICAELVVRF